MPPNQQRLVMPVGTRPCNIGGLIIVPVPEAFEMVPDPQKPTVAVFMSIEQLGLQFQQVLQNQMNLSALLHEIVEHVRPGMIAELMTKDLIDPQPYRTALIEGLKSLEEAGRQQRAFIDQMVAQAQADPDAAGCNDEGQPAS